MHKVLVTFLPAKNDNDVPYMDIHDFAVLPATGDFIRFADRETQTFQVVQVVHSLPLGGEEETFCVTVVPHELSHATILKSEESRDNRVSG